MTTLNIVTLAYRCRHLPMPNVLGGCFMALMSWVALIMYAFWTKVEISRKKGTIFVFVILFFCVFICRMYFEATMKHSLKFLLGTTGFGLFVLWDT